MEGESGVVAVDSTLTVSDSRALRARLEALGKPLLAVLVTHAHPDHYGGLSELVAGDDVPIVAVAGVDEVIRRDDDLKDAILRPMFGDEWPHERTFPNQTAEDGETLDFDGLRFTALDLGPSESPHDSVWLLGDDRRTAFPGDQVYNRMHQYLADGFYEEWLTTRPPALGAPARRDASHRTWGAGRTRHVRVGDRIHRNLRHRRQGGRLVRSRTCKRPSRGSCTQVVAGGGTATSGESEEFRAELAAMENPSHRN